MMSDVGIRKTVMEAVASYYKPLTLVLLSTPDNELHKREADRENLELMFEAFADRAYTDSGKLVSRKEPNAVHSHSGMLDQVRQLYENGTVTTTNKILPLGCDTLCVHGDNMTAVAAIREIRSIISGE